MTDKIIPPTPSRAEYLDNGPRQMGWLEADEPISLFEKWLAKAGETEPNDPNAMSLATVGADGLPDVRIILLKGVSEAGICVLLKCAQRQRAAVNGHRPSGALLSLEVLASPGAGAAALCIRFRTRRRTPILRSARAALASGRGRQSNRALSRLARPWWTALKRLSESMRIRMCRARPIGMAGAFRRTPLSFGRTGPFACMTVCCLPSRKRVTGRKPAYTLKKTDLRENE